jgi:hypothetical protein
MIICDSIINYHVNKIRFMIGNDTNKFIRRQIFEGGENENIISKD